MCDTNGFATTSESETSSPTMKLFMCSIARLGTLKRLRIELRRGGDPNERKNGTTPLHAAIASKDKSLLKTRALLDAKASVDQVNARDETALWIAAADESQLRITELLLERGARVDFGVVINTFLSNKTGTAEVLLEHKVSLENIFDFDLMDNLKIQSGAIFQKCRKFRLSMFRVSEADKKLWRSAKYDDVKQLRITLKEMGLRSQSLNTLINGQTPLHAAISGHRDHDVVLKVRALLDAKALIDFRDWFGETPAKYAMRLDRPDALELLLERGAKTDSLVTCILHDHLLTILADYGVSFEKPICNYPWWHLHYAPTTREDVIEKCLKFRLSVGDAM